MSAGKCIVFAITLAEDGSPGETKKFLRLPPPNSNRPYLLRFIIPAGSDTLVNGKLITNYPIDGKCFERHRFLPLSFNYDFITDGYCEFLINKAGAFEYFVEYEQQDGSFCRPNTPGYFVVDPKLMINTRLDSFSSSSSETRHIFNMDSICLLTVISKWLGPLSCWKDHFQSISESGYNMVHFVPLQERGVSNSPYSIYDQLSLSSDLFDTSGLSEEEKESILLRELERIETEDGILRITDIVWNHTACNSDWLQDHPEAGYNLLNSPHLRPAYELDEAIIKFSKEIDRYGCVNPLNTERDVDDLLATFNLKIIPEIRLWEFYVLNVDQIMKEFQEYLEANTTVTNKSYDDIQFMHLNHHELTEIIGKKFVLNGTFGIRHTKRVKIPDVACILRSKYYSSKLSKLSPEEVADICSKFKDILLGMNLEYYKLYDTDLKRVMENLKIRIKYERIASNGPNMGKICEKSPMVSTYFTRIRKTSRNANRDSGELVLANNGWIWNADPLVDFAGPNSKSYLIRELIPWGDCTKMRYGSSREDSPWLWDHMKNYTLKMAKMFHGFRIDNCHSTPIHVAQYFLDEARKFRPDLYVVAELFTGSEERDIIFVSKLGINSLIREAMNAWNSEEMSRLIHQYGRQAIGSVTLRHDYLPLDLVGHKTADVTSPILSPMKHEIQWVDDCSCDVPDINFLVLDPDESGRKTSKVTYLSNSDEKGSFSESNSQKFSIATKSLHLNFRSHNPPVLKEGSDQYSHEVVYHLTGSAPHALFMDCTHDNETPFQKRTAEDSLSNSALVAMSTCAVGSVKGYDELIPKHLNIVTESRKYQLTNTCGGIIPAKSAMMRLHYLMGQKGYVEIYVHQEKEFVIVSRQHPFTHHGYLLIANTGFTKHCQTDISPIILRNSSMKIILAARINAHPENYRESDEYINGLPSSLEISYESALANMISYDSGKDNLGFYIKITPNHFPSGSILLLETDLQGQGSRFLDQFHTKLGLTVHGSWYLDGIVRSKVPDLNEALHDLNLVEMNILLFRCDQEERDMTCGNGVYEVPGYGKLAYAGLQGWASILKEISARNDLGHPLCDHLRKGCWALNYNVERLDRHVKMFPKLQKIRNWLSERFELVIRMPNYLVPKYFNIVIMTAYRAAQNFCLLQMSPFLSKATRSTRALALTVVQVYGLVPSTGLSPKDNLPCLAAGLPFFSTHHMRCWGRDVFISLRGLCLITGLFDIAKSHIIHFGSCMRHGLIPNLLDSGRKPRYNSRDAVWWFLQAVQDYTKFSPDSLAILDESISMRFPAEEYVDWNDPNAYTKTTTIRELIHEIMQMHAKGIHFRELNAGPDLDHVMIDEGFNMDITFDKTTGFLFGGNEYNCGTWMDKMGESGKAGTKGKPATPRDGAAVEIIGLLKSTVRWLEELSQKDLFPKGVRIGDEFYSYQNWNEAIQIHFESCFYIPKNPENDAQFDLDPKFINRRGIYKDSYKSSSVYTDYQLRPNFPIAMVVAPELFNREHAAEALITAERVLRGPLGLKTLDPNDWAYRGDYDNNNDSTDSAIARGFNYHQGPEWLWPLGFLLRAIQKFTCDDSKSGKIDLRQINSLHRMLRVHKHILLNSPFAGLPELTNSNGTECIHSCATQAWSASTLMDMIGDLRVRVSDAFLK